MRRRCRRSSSGWPAQSMNASVGPLSTWPRDERRHRDHRRGRARSAVAHPGTARIGPIEITGFDGPIDDRVGASRARRAPRGVGRRVLRARGTRRPRPGPAALSRIMNSWNGVPAALRSDVRADRFVAHRQHVRRDAQRVSRARRSPRSAARPPLSRRARRRQMREVAVAEVEPDVLAELAQAVHHVRRCRPRCPSRARRSGRRARTSRGRGRGRRSRRRSRCRRRCWRSPTRSSPSTSSIPRASLRRRSRRRAGLPVGHSSSGSPVRRMPACVL